jgi:8-oxo-dGTP pyrophosphatase MutT (NUDIX family)
VLSYPDCLRKIQNLLQNSPRRHLEVPTGYRRAAILVPIFYKNGEWNLLFTRRTEKVTHHKNEISFPGGRFDEGVDEDIIQAALREVNEELGCEDVNVLGILDDIFTVSQYIVTPVVGYILEEIDDICSNHNSDEIQYVLTVPTKKISDPSIFWTQPVPYDQGKLFHVPFFKYNSEIIWGATGRVVVNFLNVLLDLDSHCREVFIGNNQWEAQSNEDYTYLLDT